MLLERIIYFPRFELVFSLRYQGRKTQSENRKLTQHSMNARKLVFFTQCLARIQLRRKYCKTI